MRLRPTAAQMDALLNFLEEHRDLARGKLRSGEGRVLSHQLWEEISSTLNAMDDGIIRTTKQWQRCWRDKKCTVKKAAFDAFLWRSSSETGGGLSTAPALSQQDIKVISILGNEFDEPQPTECSFLDFLENTYQETSTKASAIIQLNVSPIMQLFKRLISNDNKQNMVLTNVQIISILNKEFDIDITVLHELEVDIYLNIVKRFLKDWPQWDEFDRGISLLQKQNDTVALKKTLENNYKSLKYFLKRLLDAAKPLAKEAVFNLSEEHSKQSEAADTRNLVLEISCSRKQLNELIYNHPDADSYIFNLPEVIPNTNKYNSIPLNAMLNWCGIKVKIESQYLNLTRNNRGQLKHTLVNRYNGPRDLRQDVNTNVQIKDQRLLFKEWDKKGIYKVFDTFISNLCVDTPKMHDLLVALMRVLKSDLDAIAGKVRVPALYRQCSNKYPYYRKLSKELPTPQTEESLYDLYIEEILTPMHVLNIVKVGFSETNLNATKSNQVSLVFDCVECDVKFSEGDFYALLTEHFNVYHNNEPDWMCTNCDKTFQAIELADKKWYHECEKSPKE